MSTPRTGSGARLGVRRLLGLDRSGPPPIQTRSDQPLRPFTIPNLVGYLRLAAIPVFLYIALESSDGRTAASSVMFAVIAASDYLDGLLARITGQYSRMGAILDPVVDRITILAGVVVCWHFELLPRWALAVLALRELAMLLLAQLALRRGLQLEINWVGRISVWPVMAGIFFALTVETALAEVLFFIGLALALLATVLYVRVALAGLERPAREAE